MKYYISNGGLNWADEIDFDGNRYTFNGKAVLLKDLIGDEKQ